MGTSRREANFDAEIAALQPAKLLHFVSKSYQTRLGLRIVFREAHQDRYVPDALALLRHHRKRPCGC